MYVGMQECRNVGMQECMNIGMQECRNVGMQECRNVGIQECRKCRNVTTRHKKLINKLQVTELYLVYYQLKEKKCNYQVVTIIYILTHLYWDLQ